MKYSYIGIDGCKIGWIVVEIFDELNFRFEIIENIAEIQKYTTSQILIDMPIGLGDEFIERNLDIEAKKLLSTTKKSSIFMPPCRKAVYAESYEKAKIVNKSIMGKSISIQAWNICKKIKEVDQFLREESLEKPFLQEAHPEICFTLLNGGKSFSSKKSTFEGQTERLKLLKKNFKNAEKIYRQIIEATLRKEAKKDDILDAMALAISAYNSKNMINTILKNKPLKDSEGLEMSLWIHL